MSEAEQSINNVSQSITDLSATLSENAKRFALSSSRIVEWSKSTGKAGKRWTTFSRLTSGTGLWKFQNYLRGTLEVIGAFGERTDEAIKAQTEQEKALAKSIQGVRNIRKEYNALSEVVKNQTNLDKNLMNLKNKEDKEIKKRRTNQIKTQGEVRKQNKLLQERLERQKEIQEEIANVEKGRNFAGKVKELKELNKLEKMATAQLEESKKLLEEKQQKLDDMKSVESIREEFEAQRQNIKELAKYSDAQIQALESTTAFNTAIIAGKTDAEAYADAFKQIGENVELNQKSFDAFKKKQQEVLKIQEAFDKGTQSAEFSKLGKDVRDQRDKLKDTRKKESEEFKQKVGEGAKGTFQVAKKGTVGLLKNVNPKTLFKNVKKSAKFTTETYKKIRKAERIQKMRLKLQMKAIAFQQFMKPILNMAFKFLIFGILGMIAVLAIAKVAYDIMGVMSSFGVFDDIKEIIGHVITIGGAIFGIIGSFLSGDFESMFDYLGTIMSSLMSIGWNLITIFAKGLFAIAVGLFYSLIEGITWFFGGGWKVALPAILKLGLIILALYFVKYLLSQALLIIAIYALPIMMWVLLGALLTALFMKLYKEFEMIRNIADGAVAYLEMAWDFVTGIWKAIRGSINDVLDWFGADKLATGGLTDGNTTLVGENGPERVRLPAGSRVYSNSQSRSMTGGSTVINNHITINAKDTSDAELRRIAEKIGNMVNNKMNRTVSSRTLG